MTKHYTALFLALLCLILPGLSQIPVLQPVAVKKFIKSPIKDELTPEQRKAIDKMLKENETLLRLEGKLATNDRTATTLFEWPLRQALGYNDNGYYQIGNYVDEDPAPFTVLDYNCGERTYDGHFGTDIGLWPFPWQKVAKGAVEVVAAAAGTIIGKSDNNFDMHCGFCTGCDWNAVYIMHSNGSVAWYGHMKSGSITTKNIGQTVATGEYLGVVASSGYSTGPHLHFEVHADNLGNWPPNLIDPWAGNCNNINGNTSSWANQQPYRVPTVNKLMSHSAFPSWDRCAADENVNERLNYASGDLIYLTEYYRDQNTVDSAYHTIYKPDNSVFQTWISDPSGSDGECAWFWNWYLPDPAPSGNWRYELTYRSKKHSIWFTVNSGNLMVCPGNTIPVFSNLSGSSYQWQVNTGSGFTNISDNSFYAGTSTNKLTVKNVPSTFNGYRYRCRMMSGTFSQVLTLKLVSFWNGSKNKNWEDPSNWTCGNVPDANTDVIIQNDVTNFPEINSNTSCRTITINPSSTLTVKPGSKLTVTK